MKEAQLAFHKATPPVTELHFPLLAIIVYCTSVWPAYSVALQQMELLSLEVISYLDIYQKSHYAVLILSVCIA